MKYYIVTYVDVFGMEETFETLADTPEHAASLVKAFKEIEIIDIKEEDPT